MSFESNLDLRSYVPRWLVENAADESVTPKASIGATHAAVIFADISGFTALTKHYQDKGNAGVEQLSLIVSDYLGRLFDVVAGLNGDVQDLYGDGFLAFWSFPEGDLARKEEALRRAVRCAAAIVDDHDRHRVSAEVEVRIRVGLVVGEIFTLQIGGVAGRWMFSLAGTCLLQLGDLLARASPGQVVLSRDAQTSLALPEDLILPGIVPRLSGPALQNQEVLLIKTLEHPLPRLDRFLPPLLHQGYPGQTAWLAEFRVLAVLGICLPKLRCLRKEDLAHIQETFGVIQRSIFRYEGSILSVSMNEKGPLVLAAFGMPNEAHEDDLVRALAAAQEVQDTLSVTGVTSRCVVMNGSAYCGVVGNDLRRTYTIMGDVVNRAAKLASNGDEPAIISDIQTERKANRVPLPLQPALGNTFPSSSAIGETRPMSRDVRRPNSPLVGRERELKWLQDRVALLLEQGNNSAIHIAGEAGIGKTSLVSAIRDFVAGRALVWHSTADALLGRTTPYGAWMPIFAALFGEEQAHFIFLRARQNLARQGLDSALSTLGRAALPFISLAEETDGNLFPEDAARFTRSSLISILKDRQQGQPCIVILEDTHWMDSSSWALALQFIREIQKALLLLVSRPLTGDFSAEQREFFKSVVTETLKLESLSRTATKALLAHALNCQALSAEVIDAVHVRAGGNPFHAIQLGLALREHGAVAIDDGVCRVSDRGSDLSIIKLPDTVQRAILARVDRLPKEAQITLKVASIFGVTFAHSALDSVLPLPDARDRIAVNLQPLIELGVVDIILAGPQPLYRFNHVLTQEVLYGLLPFAQRRLLHKSAAEFFECQGDPAVRPSHAVLGYHWSRAEEPQRALPYWEKAGLDAFAATAYREAVNTFSEALKILESDTTSSAQTNRLGQLRRRLGEAYLQTGDVELSRRQFAESLGCFGYRWPRKGVETYVELCRQIARRLWLIIWHTGLPAEQGSTLPHLEAASVYESFAQVFGHSTEWLEMLLATLAALNISHLSGDRRIYSRASGLLALAMLAVRSRPLARHYFDHCRKYRPDSDNPHDRLMTTEYIAMYLMTVGRFREAETELEAMIALAEQVHNRRRACDGRSLLVLTRLARGDFKRCSVLLDRLSQDAPADSDPQLHCWACLERAELALLRGDAARARACLDEADENLEQLGNNEKIWSLGLRSLSHYLESRHAKAVDTARCAIELLKKTPLVAFYAQGGFFGAYEILLYSLRAQAEHSVKYKSVRVEAHTLVRELSRFSRVPIYRPRALLLMGQYRAALGDIRAAASCFQQALAASLLQERAYEQGLAHKALSHLGLPPSERALHAQAAAAIMCDLDVTIDTGLERIS